MCDCTEFTMCVPCQAAEAWDGEPECDYVDPYCMTCGRHEDEHDEEMCLMLQEDLLYEEYPPTLGAVVAAQVESGNFWSMISWIDAGSDAWEPVWVWEAGHGYHA